MTKSVDPDQTAPIGAVCLLLYLIPQYARQLFAAEDLCRRHFQMHFFLAV